LHRQSVKRVDRLGVFTMPQLHQNQVFPTYQKTP
jgi:hypothetical protein